MYHGVGVFEIVFGFEGGLHPHSFEGGLRLSSSQDITGLLVRCREGDCAAFDEMIPLVISQ
jgi:hypothetical protein